MKVSKSAWAIALDKQKALVVRIRGYPEGYEWFAYRPGHDHGHGAFGATPLAAITQHYRNIDDAKPQ